jgi:hypothetical protein
MQNSNYYSDGFGFTDSVGGFLGLPSWTATSTNNNPVNLIITPTPSSSIQPIHMGTQTQELPPLITIIGRSLKGTTPTPESNVTTTLLTSTTSTTTSPLTTFLLKPTESPSPIPTEAHFTDYENNYSLDAYNDSNESSSVNKNGNFTTTEYANWTSNVTLDDGENISGYANLTVTNDTTNHSELRKVEFVSRDNTTALVTASTTSTTTNSSSTTITTRVTNGSAATTTTQAKIFINTDNATANITSAALQTSTSAAPITFTHKLTNASNDSTTTFISDDGKGWLNITNGTNDSNGSYVATYESVSSSTTATSTTWVLGSDSKTSTTTTTTRSSTTTTYNVTGTTTTATGGPISTTISHSGSPTKSPTGFSDSFYINETTDLEIDINGSNNSEPFKVVKNETTYSPTPSPVGIHLPTHTKY